jgi:type 1 fimbriae regulatory protein FimB/type 1 fimbriae regulatory protein FimE
MECARKRSRYGHRDATMILVAYRHGLRASELCGLEWHQVELDAGRMHVRRAKNGTPSVHPIRGDEIRALRRLRRENPIEAHVFVTERGGPMTAMGFHHLMARLGKAAEMPFAVHPHMLRHACGYKLANDGHDTRAERARIAGLTGTYHSRGWRRQRTKRVFISVKSGREVWRHPRPSWRCRA